MKIISVCTKYIAAILFSSFFAQKAMADVILPAFYFKDPFLAILIVPVILIEYVVMKRYLNIQHNWEVLRATAMANIFSAAVGYPILVIISAGIGLFFEVFRYFFRSISSSSYLFLSTFAFLIIIIAFLMSYVMERAITLRLLPKESEVNIKQAVWQANIVSYVFLTITVVILEMYNGTGKSFLCLYYKGGIF